MPIDYPALDALAAKLMLRRKAHPMRETGFIYRHGKRVTRSVILLRERIHPGDASHDDALRVAAMFHDIGKGIEPHHASGAALARALLQDLLPSDLLEESARLIALHNNHQTADPWAMLLQDADVLDHFGMVEVLLSAQYGAYDEQGIDTMLDWYREQYGPYCERTRAQLHHSLARDLFDQKVAFTLAFVARLEREAAGEYMI